MQQIKWIIIIALLFIFFITLLGFYFSIRPIKVFSSMTPKYFGVQYENIQFKTTDNIIIRGWFIPNKNIHAKTIILLHGYPMDKGNILPTRIFLHKDYNLLFIDFRYLGESGGHYSTIGKNEVLDLRAAIDYLHHRNIHQVAVWGLSLGAAVALLAAPDTPEIKAIVNEASYARLDWIAYNYYRSLRFIPGLQYIMGNALRFWAWIFLNIDIKQIQPVQALAQLKIPILMIYSKNDQVVTYPHALAMQQAARHNPRAQMIILEHAQHGELMKNYEKIIKDFFDKNL